MTCTLNCVSQVTGVDIAADQHPNHNMLVVDVDNSGDNQFHPNTRNWRIVLRRGAFDTPDIKHSGHLLIVDLPVEVSSLVRCEVLGDSGVLALAIFATDNPPDEPLLMLELERRPTFIN